MSKPQITEESIKQQLSGMQGFKNYVIQGILAEASVQKQENTRIQQLENQWLEIYAKAYKERRNLTDEEETQLRTIISSIKTILSVYENTTSRFVNEMEQILNGFVMSEEFEKMVKEYVSKIKGGKHYKSTRKQKKSRKNKKSKKSHRRHHSKSK